jgi:PAT family acetyl-CoA transporter-like MFS transporter 1
MPPLLVFLNGFKARLFNGVLTVLLIFVLGIYSAAGDAIPLWLYIVAIGIIAVGGVASAAMFVAQMAFFNRVSDPKIGGTYMTMLNTISNLGGQWPGTFIFATKGAIERVTDAQTGFYGVCAVSVVVGLVWFYLMQGRLHAIQSLPAKRWIASS